jgi:hypothetical protein
LEVNPITGEGQSSQEVHCAQEGEERSNEPRRIIPKETLCRMSPFLASLRESMVFLRTLVNFFLVVMPARTERDMVQSGKFGRLSAQLDHKLSQIIFKNSKWLSLIFVNTRNIYREEICLYEYFNT